MSNVAVKAAELIDMLPEDDQNFAYEFLKKWFVPGILIILG
jgi:hypothetical protein